MNNFVNNPNLNVSINPGGGMNLNQSNNNFNQFQNKKSMLLAKSLDFNMKLNQY
jgi:hypothetical protein